MVQMRLFSRSLWKGVILLHHYFFPGQRFLPFFMVEHMIRNWLGSLCQERNFSFCFPLECWFRHTKLRSTYQQRTPRVRDGTGEGTAACSNTLTDSLFIVRGRPKVVLLHNLEAKPCQASCLLRMWAVSMILA